MRASSSGSQKLFQERDNALREPVEVIPALQDPNASALTKLLCDVTQAARQESVVVSIQLHLGERIAAVGVKAGAHQQQCGLVLAQRRHKDLIEHAHVLP